MSLSDNFKVDSNGNGTFKGTVKIENGNSTANLSSATISSGTIRGGTFGGGGGGGGPTFASGTLAQSLGVAGSSNDLKHWISDELIVQKLTADFLKGKIANIDIVTVKALAASGVITG
jgi:hypothetical protein